MIVISKPPGLLCVPGRQPELPNAVDLIKQWLLACSSRLVRDSDETWFHHLFTADASSPPPPIDSLRAAHRLDMNTSGVVAFATDSNSHSLLSRLLQLPKGRSLRIKKRYVAVVDARLAILCGFPITLADEGVITTPLRSNSHMPIVVEPYSGGVDVASPRHCETRWRVLYRGSTTIRLELEPVTGRTHQLRLHTSLLPPLGLGCPIVGDNIYGDPDLTTQSYLPDLIRRYPDVGGQLPTSTSVAHQLMQAHALRSQKLLQSGLGPQTIVQATCSDSSGARFVVPSPVMLLHAQELIIPDWSPPQSRRLSRRLPQSETIVHGMTSTDDSESITGAPATTPRGCTGGALAAPAGQTRSPCKSKNDSQWESLTLIGPDSLARACSSSSCQWRVVDRRHASLSRRATATASGTSNAPAAALDPGLPVCRRPAAEAANADSDSSARPRDADGHWHSESESDSEPPPGSQALPSQGVSAGCDADHVKEFHVHLATDDVDSGSESADDTGTGTNRRRNAAGDSSGTGNLKLPVCNSDSNVSRVTLDYHWHGETHSFSGVRFFQAPDF